MNSIIEIENDLELNKIIENARESLKETKGDIAKKLLKQRLGKKVVKESSNTSKLSNKQKNLGKNSFFFYGDIHSGRNVKETYLKLLRTLQVFRPEFYGLLAKEETFARRIIAKNPKDLYKKSPHLVDKCAFEIESGWWVDTNLSNQQVSSHTETACRILDLKYGSDLVLNI